MNTGTHNGETPRAVDALFLDKLGGMWTAEKELTVALPLMEKAATSDDLKTLLQIHLDETRGHVDALEAVARHLNCRLPTKTCAPITELIAEGLVVIGKRLVYSQQDAELIRVGREIEQFEIRSYRDLCASARDQAFTHEVALLTSVLNQEEMADELLSELAAGKGPIKELVEKASLRRIGS